MSPADRSYLDEDASPAGESRRGSRLVAVLLTLVIGGVLASCCACGGFLYLYGPEFQEDPDAAQALAGQLLPMDVPAVFEPRGTIVWTIWPLMTMKGVYYEHTFGEGELTLLQIDSAYMSQQGFREHVTRSLQEQGAGSGFELAVQETVDRSIDVYGRPVTFRFTKAEDRTSGDGRRLVEGVVEGPDGPVLLNLWVDEENWSEEQTVEMIESIGRRPDEE